MKKLLVIAAALALAVNGSLLAAVSVTDATNTDWDGIKRADPTGDKGTGADMVYFGAVCQNDSGTDYIYCYFEDPNMSLYFDGGVTGDWNLDQVFGGSFFDMDRVSGSNFWGNIGGRNGWNGPSMVGADADNLSNELSAPTAAGASGPIRSASSARVSPKSNPPARQTTMLPGTKNRR